MTDAGIASDELVRKIGRAVEGGVALVQLRDKTLPGGRLLDLARSIVQVIDGRAKLVVNERADVALISDSWRWITYRQVGTFHGASSPGRVRRS